MEAQALSIRSLHEELPYGQERVGMALACNQPTAPTNEALSEVHLLPMVGATPPCAGGATIVAHATKGEVPPAYPHRGNHGGGAMAGDMVPSGIQLLLRKERYEGRQTGTGKRKAVEFTGPS